MELPTNLLENLKSGKVLLILGAGASFGAKHPDNQKIPFGNELRDLLVKKFLDPEFEGHPLASVGELAISESSLIDVQTYIKEIFERFEPNQYHSKLLDVNWVSIVTLNYDEIVEKVYKKSEAKKIVPFVCNDDRIDIVRTSANDIYLLKLHGCISRYSNSKIPMILSYDQYADYESGRKNVYNLFQQLASEYTMVFVGTELVDTDLRRLFQWLEEHIDSRSRGYLITPYNHRSVASFWEKKQITCINGTFEEFLNEASKAVLSQSINIPSLKLNSPIEKQLTVQYKQLSTRCKNFIEMDCDYVYPEMDIEEIDCERFYKGFGQGWGPIQRKLDCPRRINEYVLQNTVLNAPDDGVYFFLITGSAGSGKTITLRRLAWDAAEDLEGFCLYFKQDTDLDFSSILEICNGTDKRLFLFIDNASTLHKELNSLINQANEYCLNITIIANARTNEWNDVEPDFDQQIDRKYPLYFLYPNEIKKLLGLLKEHNALGSLEPLNDKERLDKLVTSDQGQILVTLHEALMGKPFLDIVVDEYNSITNSIAKQVYLTICTLNYSGTPVRAGLISRIHNISLDDFRRSFLAPLDGLVNLRDGRRGYDIEYHARHPHVAEIVYNQIFSDQSILVEKLVQIIKHMNISFESDRESYTRIIKKSNLINTFSRPSHIREIYNAAIESNPDDGHAYLHRALFEMQSGEHFHKDSEKYLQIAEELLPQSSLISNARSSLLLEKSKVAKNLAAREATRKQALNILNVSTDSGLRENSYAVTLKIKIHLEQIKDILSNNGDPIKLTETVRDAEKSITSALQKFPHDEFILKVESDFAEILGNSEDALLSLEKAAELNYGNISIVTRLARIYRKNGDLEKAKLILMKAIEVRNFDKKLNFLLAKILLELNDSTQLIEMHLRRSFSPNDDNYVAQKLYGRQLYINGKHEESKKIFLSSRKFRISPTRIRVVDNIWSDDGGIPKDFTGRVIKSEYNYGVAIRNDNAERVFMPENIVTVSGRSQFSLGDLISFNIGFNFKGPATTNVRLMSLTTPSR